MYVIKSKESGKYIANSAGWGVPEVKDAWQFKEKTAAQKALDWYVPKNLRSRFEILEYGD